MISPVDKDEFDLEQAFVAEPEAGVEVTGVPGVQGGDHDRDREQRDAEGSRRDGQL